MNVAQLTIEMAANVARLKTDMAAARNTVEGTMNSIKKAAGAARVALGAIGVGLSVNAFAGWIKGAINAADEANKLSQKIGIAVKEIGGLQLAFSQGGVDAESMSSSLAKLNKNIAAGDSAFKTLGVATKNADGSLRSTTDVLADIADRFAGTENNANKTAMAIDLFGKSGAALIPVLNAGGSSIREFQVLAQQLGLTLSEETALAAEKFNDTLELISMGSRGIANQVMAELLPTLQTLAGEFLNLMTQGGNLKGVADVISAGLKGLFTVAAVGVEIFRTLGNTIGATAAGIVAFASGDFAGAASVIRELGKDIRTNWTGTLESLDRLWNQSGNTAIEAAAKITSGSLQSGKAMEEAAKAAKKLADEQEKARKAADDLVASIAFETETMQMSNLEREIANNLLKLEKTGLQENTEEYRAYAEAIRLATIENEGIKQRIKLEKDAADKRRKIEEDYAREVEQINFQIGQSLTDALINGGTTAKEFLINMFKTLILRPILQPIITGGTSAVMSLLGMGGTANASTGTGSLASASQLGQLASLGSTINNAYNALTSATLGAADAIAAGAQSATFAIADALGGMGFENAAAALFESAGSIGIAAQGLAGVAAGTFAGEWISGGKSLIGGNSLYTTAGGAAAGAAIGTAVLPGIGSFVGGIIGGIVGGIANAGWGSGAQEYGATGLRGTFTPEGVASSRLYNKWTSEGGYFGGGGSGENSYETPEAMVDYLNTSVGLVTTSIVSLGKTLGLSSDAIKDYSFVFERELGNTTEEQQANLNEIFSQFGEGMAKMILNTDEYSLANETALQTLKRLSTSLSGVNSTFETLGLKLFDISLAGAAASDAFVNLMGGIEAFTESTNFYYQNFYTEVERSAKTIENLTKIFGEMNLEMPQSRSAFRAMVDAAQEAGDSALVASLLKLAPTFASIFGSADAALQIAKDNQIKMLQNAKENELKRLKIQYDANVKSINSNKSYYETLANVSKDKISELNGIFNILGDSIKNIIKNVIPQTAAGFGIGFIDRALATAKTTGYLPASDDLSNAIASATGSLGAENFATKFEMQRANLVLAGKLQQLQEIGGEQKSVAEKQLEAATKQIEQLDAQLVAAQEQYEADVERANKTYEMMATNFANQINAINGVTDAVNNMTAQYKISANAASSVSWAAKGEFSQSGAAGSLNVSGYRFEGDQLVSPNGQRVEFAGANPIQRLIENYGLIAQSDGTYIRTRANGGYTPPGMTLVGENGPELVNFQNPAMVYNSAQTGGIFASGMTEELRGLREDNRAQARALVQLQTRMNRLLERWDGDGIPETREVTA